MNYSLSKSYLAICLLVWVHLTPASHGQNQSSPASPTGKPKLVVLVVFDQMRGDYIDKWKELFGKDGFVRLETEGAWFQNCHYPYACTATGPGHSSMLTGTCPDIHGIIGNSWYDAKEKTSVYCATTPRYKRVPPAPKKVSSGSDTNSSSSSSSRTQVSAFGAPDRLLAQSVGDALKTAYPQAKVVGISLKDRAAVLTAGKKADLALWLDTTTGEIVTSTYYRDSLPVWVTQFNQAKSIDRWFDKPWQHLRNDLEYEKYSGPDKMEGEGTGVKQGTTFPHPMNGGKEKISSTYYKALYNSPMGNEFLLQLAKETIRNEKLGQRDCPDLLAISFSSNDSVGHAWGPDSQEVLDTTLRSDLIVAELLKELDHTVGQGQYLLALSADHGICPLPEVSQKKNITAKRIVLTSIIQHAELDLEKTFGDPNKDSLPDTKPLFWIEKISGHWIYLNHTLIQNHQLKPEVIADHLTKFLAKQDGIGRAWSRSTLMKLKQKSTKMDFIDAKMCRAFHPERSGDIGFINSPYFLMESALFSTGTSHGTPYPYDTHVPLLFYGPGIQKGIYTNTVTPQSIAAVFVKALGIPPMKTLEYPIPDKLWQTQK